MDEQQLHQLLEQVKISTANQAHQASRHNPAEKLLQDIPPDVTRVYVRQHHTKGLEAPYEGPFNIEERISRSVIKIDVGRYKDGSKRFEY